MKPVLLTVSLCMTILACEEPLPPRNDPPVYLQAGLVASEGRLVFIDSATVIIGRMMIRITLRNAHDEALQGPARVRGDVHVTLRDHPDKQKSFTWTQDDLQSPGVVRGGVATLGVDSSAMLSSLWDQRTDGGEPFWKFAHYTLLFSSKGDPYYQSDSVYFVADGKMQLFDEVQALQAPSLTYAVVYQIWRSTPPQEHE